MGKVTILNLHQNIDVINHFTNRPEDAAWEGGTFKLTLEFSEDYPTKAPVVKFVTKVFHPNGKVKETIFLKNTQTNKQFVAVYNDGAICLDILDNQWTSLYDIAAILTSIQSLLCDPNPNSPANAEAARLYTDNKREYFRRVRECVERSWEEVP